VPFYFGAQDLRDGDIQSFSVPDSDARVDVLNSAVDALSWGHTPLDREQENLISSLCDAAGRSDRMLLDVGPVHTEQILKLHSDSQIGLVSLVPDLNSVVGVMRLEEFLRARREEEADGLEPFYVLNKLDSSLALHRSIQSRLRDELGHRLLPIAIRRSDAIPEALADGKTVIDYCPDTGVAEDFMGLANWLLQELPIGRTRGRE
jgi:cellulose biosynthesis protein BcsQ